VVKLASLHCADNVVKLASLGLALTTLEYLAAARGHSSWGASAECCGASPSAVPAGMRGLVVLGWVGLELGCCSSPSAAPCSVLEIGCAGDGLACERRGIAGMCLGLFRWVMRVCALHWRQV
jgi:hypothetical protein